MKENNCNHNLISIYNHFSRGIKQVVRWCDKCGAIVIDEDFDSRTKPGSIMKMRLPKNEIVDITND